MPTSEGSTDAAIGYTRGLPVPTRKRKIRPVKRRSTSPFGDPNVPAKPDPDAIARLARLGILTVTQEVVDDRNVSVVTRTKRSRGRTGYRVHIDIDAASADYRAGANLNDLGAKYGISGETMRGRLVDAGVQIRPRNKPKAKPQEERHDDRRFADHDAICKLGRERVPTVEIAKRLNVHRRTVTKHLAQEGIAVPHTRPKILRVDVPTEQIVAEYREGASISALARKWDVERITIRRRLAATPGLVLRADDRRDAATALRDYMAEHGATSAQVREWARANGHEHSAKGVPPRLLIEQYLSHRNTTEGRKSA